MKIAVFAAVALIAGCVETPKPIPDNLTPKLALMPGLDIHVLINRWGYPTDQREIAGDVVYEWVTEFTAPMPVPNMTFTTGQAGGQPFNATTMQSQTGYFRFHCRVEIATEGNGRIIRSHVDGDTGTCSRYGRLLEH